MAIPRVLHPIKPQDFSIRPLTVHKRFLVQKGDLYSGSFPQTSSGYVLWEGLHSNEKMRLGTASELTYPTNSFDGTFKWLTWRSIDKQFYKFPYDPGGTLEHSNQRFTKKFLNYSSSIVSLPYLDFGESIKPGSIELTGSNFYLTDDKNGNLYDVSLSTGSYSDRHNLIAYWGFNDEFRRNKTIPEYLQKTKISYYSSQFQDVEGSTVRNVKFDSGVLLNSTSSGMAAYFTGNSSIYTPHKDEFNFSKIDDFTIGFWVYFEPAQNGPNTIISKNGLIAEQVWGNVHVVNQNGIEYATTAYSQSIQYKPVGVYPFRFEINGGTGIMHFMRSDGKTTVNLSGSLDLDDATWHHYAAVKTGSSLILYEDGVVVQSGSEVPYHPLNQHSLVFGSDDFGSTNSFNGRVDEVRIYNKGLSSATISTLSDNSTLGMYQSSIVGNAFYKSGNIVVSSLDPKYNQILNQNWILRYRGTHTIYQYECLVRIKKGWFNLSMNPTMRQSPNSDLLINDATGSFEDGALYPYATTIGMYSDDGSLVAVAKLNQPLQMRPDVDLNIQVRWHS